METLLLPAVTLSATLALFVALYKLVRTETLRGQRVVLVRVRGWVDSGLDWVGQQAHGVVQRMSRVFRTRREAAERVNTASALMRHATRTPLTVTHTDNHLSKMRDHKSETKLTPAQGRKLRHKKLEERF